MPELQLQEATRQPGSETREARARHDETTTRQRHCSGKEYAHQKRGTRRPTRIARRCGTAAKAPARGLGGGNTDGVPEEAQTTTGSTAAHDRVHRALRCRCGGASSWPGAAESGSPCHHDRGSLAGNNAPQGSRATISTLEHAGAAESVCDADSALAGRRARRLCIQSASQPGHGTRRSGEPKTSQNDGRCLVDRVRVAHVAPSR